MRIGIVAAGVLGAAALASAEATACELDGLPGAHRFIAFRPVVVNLNVPPPASTSRDTRERPMQQARTDDRRSGSRQRSDDGQGYPSYSASDSDDGGGTPGDADWIHRSPDH